MYKTADEMLADLNDFIASKNEKDAELWKLASDALDKRIATIGERCGGTYFNEALDHFNMVQGAVYDGCNTYQNWYKLHDFNSSCAYWYDHGLGMRCVDDVSRRISSL